MTDRELLEAAARAAGLTLPHFVPYGVDDWQREWNPLTDDGAALRLAVGLCITVDHSDPDAVSAGWKRQQRVQFTIDGWGPWFWKEWLRDCEDDRNAATRRAIVRAAAMLAQPPAAAQSAP